MKVSSVHDQAMAAREALIVGASTDHTRRFMFCHRNGPEAVDSVCRARARGEGERMAGF